MDTDNVSGSEEEQSDESDTGYPKFPTTMDTQNNKQGSQSSETQEKVLKLRMSRPTTIKKNNQGANTEVILQHSQQEVTLSPSVTNRSSSLITNSPRNSPTPKRILADTGSINRGSFSGRNSPTLPSRAAADTEYQQHVIRKLNIITARLQNFEDRFDNVETLINSLMEFRQNPEINTDPELPGLLELLPLSNEEDLNKFEKILQDKMKYTYVAKSLSRIGGTSPQEITRKIMYRLISNQVAQWYSWEGGKGKKKFVNLALSKVLFDAVRLNKRTANACDDEVIDGIKRWLVKAKERHINEAKKAGSGVTIL